MNPMDKIRSIRFPEDMEKKIRVLAAEEGISFGEWVRRASFSSINGCTYDVLEIIPPSVHKFLNKKA